MRPHPILVGLLGLAAHAGAQENLGMYYQNLYFSTHVTFGVGGRRRAPRVRTQPRFNPAPPRSAAIERMVARAPSRERGKLGSDLVALTAAFPRVVAAASRATGVALRPNDVRDVATLAGVAAFQELRGKPLTNAQFADARRATYASFRSAYASSATVQGSGEAYELAILLMGTLKQLERGAGHASSRSSLHGLALDTFKNAYGSADYTRYVPTPKGIERVR